MDAEAIMDGLEAYHQETGRSWDRIAHEIDSTPGRYSTPSGTCNGVITTRAEASFAARYAEDCAEEEATFEHAFGNGGRS